jgi:cell division ATPase FtsA
VYSVAAASAACGDEVRGAERVLLADLGGWCTDLAVFEQGRLVDSITIPWGGMPVVRELAQRCQLPWDRALVLSLEGLGSRTPAVREVMQEQLPQLESALADLLARHPRPDRVAVTGGTALIDGMLEWIESTTGLPSALGRHAKAKDQTELPRQMALSTVYGLAQLAQPSAVRTAAKPTQFLNRLVDRTKILLNDYF